MTTLARSCNWGSGPLATAHRSAWKCQDAKAELHPEQSKGSVGSKVPTFERIQGSTWIQKKFITWSTPKWNNWCIQATSIKVLNPSEELCCSSSCKGNILISFELCRWPLWIASMLRLQLRSRRTTKSSMRLANSCWRSATRSWSLLHSAPILVLQELGKMYKGVLIWLRVEI